MFYLDSMPLVRGHVPIFRISASSPALRHNLTRLDSPAIRSPAFLRSMHSRSSPWLQKISTISLFEVLLLTSNTDFQFFLLAQLIVQLSQSVFHRIASVPYERTAILPCHVALSTLCRTDRCGPKLKKGSMPPADAVFRFNEIFPSFMGLGAQYVRAHYLPLPSILALST
jgi:hypothetical protein